MVEGRFVFGAMLVSVAAVILVVILGLRGLNGTLGGADSTNTIVLSGLFLAFIVVASILCFTTILTGRH